MLLPKKKKQGASFSYALAAFVLLLGAAGAVYVYTAVDTAGRGHIVDRVSTVARAIPLADFSALSGTEADIGTPEYERLKALLMDIREVNADARFLYLLGQDEEKRLFFYVDSEDPSSEDYSPAGQWYPEATEVMREFFTTGEPVSEGPDRDRWGIWISGYAPLIGEEGEVKALVGMDLPADAFVRDTYAYAALPFMAALFVACIIVAFGIARAREQAHLLEREEFLSVASHEVRTPLVGIRWALENILKNPDALTPDARTLLSLAHGSALSLVGRLNNLLDVHTLEARGLNALHVKRVSLAPLFKEIMANLELAAKERGVTLLPFSGDVALVCDRDMLRHAFFNLLSNGVKYTRAGTEVSLTYENTAEGHVFRVRDHGAGIPKGEEDKVFEGYHRTESARQGTATGSGLGLYLTKKAIELHHGSIRIESKEGEGTTFVVTLPKDA